MGLTRLEVASSSSCDFFWKLFFSNKGSAGFDASSLSGINNIHFRQSGIKHKIERKSVPQYIKRASNTADFAVDAFFVV